MQTPLRAHQRDNGEGPRRSEQEDAQAPAPGGGACHEPVAQRRCDEPIERARAAALHEEERADEDDQHPERVRPLGLGEAELAHGSLRSSVPESRAEKAIRPSAEPTKAA